LWQHVPELPGAGFGVCTGEVAAGGLLAGGVTVACCDSASDLATGENASMRVEMPCQGTSGRQQHRRGNADGESQLRF